MAKSKSESKGDSSPKGEPQRPVYQIRRGRIVAKCWRNQHPEQGVWFSTTISRLYKDGDQWKSSNSFGRDDLLLVGEVARLGVQASQVLADGGQRALPESLVQGQSGESQEGREHDGRGDQEPGIKRESARSVQG